MFDVRKCGRCNNLDWPAHHPDCPRGHVLIGSDPPLERITVTRMVETIEDMDTNLENALVDHIVSKAVVYFREGKDCVSPRCAAERAYLVWSKERESAL